MTVHPIEAESYRILAGRLDLSGWADGPAAVAARVVHATADPALVDSLVADPGAVAAGVTALRAGAPVLCDVEMVRAGVSGVVARCALGEVAEAGAYSTRTAAAMAALAQRHPDGAVVVVGCAPTALAQVVAMVAAGELRPALVVGVPVGFVGAAQSKEDLLELSRRTGVPAIVLRGERGGAAVAAAVANALVRLATASPDGQPRLQPDGGRSDGGRSDGGRSDGGRSDGGRSGAGQHDGHHVQDAGPDRLEAEGCLLIGHGTRSPSGAAELKGFAAALAAARPTVATRAGFIEFVEPGLDEAIDELVAVGPTKVVAVPLVLLGAGHMKDDGPAALARARLRHRGVSFSYARDLGVHPDVLAVVAERAADASARLPGGTADAVVVVGRGSSDPDANADLAKAARLLADGRGLGRGLAAGGSSGVGGTVAGAGEATDRPPLGLVLAAFVSLADPDVAAALEQCLRLGARRVAVVPYFLFDGLLVERIADQAARWAADHAECAVVTGDHMGIDPRLVSLAWHRFDEASGGPVHMNCDGCLYRTPLPGYEHRVGTAH